MPREAPVTSATCPSIMGCSSIGLSAQRCTDRCLILDRLHRDFFVAFDAAVQTGQHLARAAFDDARGAARHDLLYGRRPTYGAGQLTDEQSSDVRWIAMRGCVDSADVFNARWM